MMSEARWVPNERKVKKWYKEIKEFYKSGKVAKDYKKVAMNFAKIAVLLSNTDLVIYHLMKLNELVTKKANDLNMTITKNLKHNKVLRNVLEDGLAEVGFSPNFVKAIGFLEPEVFRFFLAKGDVIKDPGAGVKHGEYTHAIQWWIIASQEKENSFLDMPVIDLYKELGKESAVLRIVFDEVKSREYNIWDLIVDKLKIVGDCRSPEILQQIILNHRELNDTFLQALIKSRQDKRLRNGNQITPKDSYEASVKDPKVLVPKIQMKGTKIF
jgi:hypothetical protein